MMGWIGRTIDGEFKIQIETSVLQSLEHFCMQSDRRETGGILVGRYSDDLAVAIVREATPPPSDSRFGRSWFVRGIRGLREILAKKWSASERTYYIGEWHFHPASRVEPSADDFQQMVEIGHAMKYDCREPLLIILGSSRRKGNRDLRAFVCPAGSAPREFVVELP
jgi:integrative and conjugative element protein (TIGR02256 family)